VKLAGGPWIFHDSLMARWVGRRRALRARFNPYIAGAPVFDRRMFFGREDLAQRLLEGLGRGSVRLTGERRIGKTSLLYHLRQVLTDDGIGQSRFFPVFVDLEAVSTQKLFHALMEESVETLGLSPATRASLRLSADANHYDEDDFRHDLACVIGELRGRAGNEAKLALLIDEADLLLHCAEDLEERLHRLLSERSAHDLVAVMAGAGVHGSGRPNGGRYNGFEEIELLAFTREEAEALVTNPVRGVYRYEPNAVDRILELSWCRPYVIQRLCVHAVNRMLEGRRTTIRLADVEEAWEQLDVQAAALASAGGRASGISTST
jgi:hypothetical protein